MQLGSPLFLLIIFQVFYMTFFSDDPAGMAGIPTYANIFFFKALS